MKFSLPPVTRTSVLVLSVLSLAVFTLRYMDFSIKFDAAGKLEQQEQEKPEDERVQIAWPLFANIQVPFLTLIPGQSITFPWTIVTSGFVEETLLGFIIALASLALAGRYLERVWSSKELAIFYGMLTVIPNIATVISLVLLFGITGNYWWIENAVSGGSAIQAGFLVAFKQLVPEHAIVLFQGALRVHVKHLIMPLLVCYSTLGMIIGRPVMVVLPWTGFFTAWIWLRFYRVANSDSLLPSNSDDPQRIRGDASDTFALADFFYPHAVKALVEQVSNAVFSVLVAIKLCTPFDSDDIDASNMRASMRTGSTSDSDRRRALALKVLEGKLQN